jgi:hypothetical protein
MGVVMKLLKHSVPDTTAVFECAKAGVQNDSIELMRTYRAVLDAKYALDHEIIRMQVESFSKERHGK